MTKQILARHSPRRNLRSAPRDQRFFARTRARPKRRRLSVSSFSLLAASSVVLQFSPVLSVGGFHYNATRRHCQSYGEATHHPSPPRRPQTPVHDLPCEASRSAKMGEGRSDRNRSARAARGVPPEGETRGGTERPHRPWGASVVISPAGRQGGGRRWTAGEPLPLGLRSGFDPPDLERPGRLPHQQGLCEARLGYRDGSPQLGGP
jgi:hypothetical protein